MTTVNETSDTESDPGCAAVCKQCCSMPCTQVCINPAAGFIRVLAGSMEIPLECPLILDDEYLIKKMLLDIDPWNLEQQRIHALRSECNSAHDAEISCTYGDPVFEAVEYILQKWIQNKCTIIGTEPGQDYPAFLKPGQFPQWMVMVTNEKEGQEEYLTDALAEEMLLPGLSMKKLP